MLDRVRREELNPPVDSLPCPVTLPPEWKDFYRRRGPQQSQPGDNRRFVRSHFPTKALIEVEQTLPAFPRPRETHVVLMKDLSRQGVGFLHAAQLFPGERVRLSLATGRLVYMVTRCIRHNDACYEIGAELTRDP